MSGNKARQQQANVKARKAKSRGVAAAAQTLAKINHRTATSMLNARRTTDLIGRLNRLAPTHQQDRETAERFLCRLFGEEYRP